VPLLNVRSSLVDIELRPLDVRFSPDIVRYDGKVRFVPKADTDAEFRNPGRRSVGPRSRVIAVGRDAAAFYPTLFRWRRNGAMT
jgi:hypothetical protein